MPTVFMKTLTDGMHNVRRFANYLFLYFKVISFKEEAHDIKATNISSSCNIQKCQSRAGNPTSDRRV